LITHLKTNIFNRYQIYLSSFLMDFVSAFVVGAVAVYAVELGATPMQLGFIGSIGAALYVLSSYSGGKLSDRLSRKKIILSAIIATTISCFGLARSTVLGQLYFYYGTFNIGIGLFWPTVQSLLADSRHRLNLTTTLSNFCISWSLGFVFGHFTCGYLTRINSILPFKWAVVLCLIILAANYALSDSEGAQKLGSADFLSSRNEGKRILWRRFLACGWLANFTLVFILSSAKMLFPKLALDIDRLDKGVLGLMLALIHGGQLLMFWVVKYWHGWQYNRKIYIITQLSALPGTGLLWLTGNVACYALGMFLIGLSAGFTYSASLYYSTSRPPESSTRTGYHEGFIGLGIMLGPLSGGFVSGIWNLHTPYLLCFWLLLAAFAVQLRLLYRPQANNPEN